MNESAQPLRPVPQTAAPDRRRHRRFPGPFEGHRLDALETPVNIYDLSRGGCFITSMHEQKDGVVLTLRIELPHAGPITVTAETLARQNEFGFAVQFLRMDIESAERLDQELKYLEEREPYDP